MKITDRNNAEILEGFAVQYIQKMEKGVLPNELGSRNNHLAALISFYSRIGFDIKTATIKARRLLPHHFREGVPTEYSKVHSKTGERKNFIKATWKKQERNVDSIMKTGIDSFFKDQFKNEKSERI